MPPCLVLSHVASVVEADAQLGCYGFQFSAFKRPAYALYVCGGDLRPFVLLAAWMIYQSVSVGVDDIALVGSEVKMRGSHASSIVATVADFEVIWYLSLEKFV